MINIFSVLRWYTEHGSEILVLSLGSVAVKASPIFLLYFLFSIQSFGVQREPSRFLFCVVSWGSNQFPLQQHWLNSTVCLSHSTRSWVLDSGASDHVVDDPSLISNLSPPKIPHNITVANGSKAQVTGIGQASPLPSLSLNYVLFVPGSPFNLISISKLAQSLNCSITFSSDSFLIQDRSTGKTIGTGSQSQGLYYLHSHPSTICGVSASPDIIHRRLGHPSLDKLKALVPHLSHLKSLDCESCQLGKHVRVSFQSHATKRSMSPFDIIHSDVWGPSRVSSTLGYKYYVTFIDDFSRCT